MGHTRTAHKTKNCTSASPSRNRNIRGRAFVLCSLARQCATHTSSWINLLETRGCKPTAGNCQYDYDPVNSGAAGLLRTPAGGTRSHPSAHRASHSHARGLNPRVNAVHMGASQKYPPLRPKIHTPQIPREMASEWVSGADFWCKLMSGVRPVDLCKVDVARLRQARKQPSNQAVFENAVFCFFSSSDTSANKLPPTTLAAKTPGKTAKSFLSDCK